MRKCAKCGYEFNYLDPTGTKEYYLVELRNEMTKGSRGTVVYCKECAPFGNTKIPDQVNAND
jgi:hypothetical protein